MTTEHPHKGPTAVLGTHIDLRPTVLVHAILSRVINDADNRPQEIASGLIASQRDPLILTVDIPN